MWSGFIFRIRIFYRGLIPFRQLVATKARRGWSRTDGWRRDQIKSQSDAHSVAQGKAMRAQQVLTEPWVTRQSQRKPQRGGTKKQIQMPQSLSKIYVHIVFSTKRRIPWLRNQELRDQLFAYMATILRDTVDSPALIINGMEDHVHSLIQLSRRFPTMTVVQKMKTVSSKWLKRELATGNNFAWQAGYGAFSASASAVDEVREYIRNQEKHHQRMSFQDEFRTLCERHGLELNEEYAWD